MKKILIIDDDLDLNSTIESLLKYAGYTTFIANDGAKGIELAKNEKPDLIILDIMMPGMNGAEATTEMKKDPFLANIPIIFLSGLVSADDTESTKDTITVGEKTYLSIPKPFDNKKLLEQIKNILNS